MSRARQRRRMMAVCRFSLEGLEPRRLLSGVPGNLPNPTGPLSPSWVVDSPPPQAGTLVQPAVTPAAHGAQPLTSLVQSVITTVPADGAQLTQSPSSLVVTFNTEVDFLWEDGNVQLDRVNSDGSTTPLFDPSFPSATFDPTGSQATIPLNQTLSPGNYQIVLVGGSDVSNYVSGGLWDPSTDQTLADFTVVPNVPVVPAGVTFNDAIDLGTIGSQVTTSSGSLDLAAAQTYALYKVTLGPGHFWRLGVELDAQRIGSSLLGALTLFDQQGNVLATRDTGTGLPSSPDDPYLFTGLNPGVYYIGVSGAGNLAGQPGGYDPVTGTIGSAGQAQAGGAYDLQVVADPADSLTQVTGFSLQRADTLNSTPTGLTLTFSGAIDPNSLMSNSPVLVYNDASDKAFPMTLSSYAGSQVSFVFDQPLPSGQYTVVVPSGGLTDLIGRAPVSPGPNPGVLATFIVEPQTSPAVAGNLGVLWPSPQAQVSQFATIPPGQEFVSRVVVPVAGLYTLETSFTQGSVAILRAGPDGVAVIDPASTGPSNTYEMPLEAGVYMVSFRTVSTQPAVGQWTFRLSSIDHELIPDNGVHQDPILILRLVDPIPSSSTSGSPSVATTVLPANLGLVFSPSSPQSGSNTVPIAAPVGSGEAVAATGVSVIPASLVVTVSTGLLGTPALQNEPVAVVGPVVAGGSTALARSSSGLLPGIIHESSGVSVIPASLVVTVSTGLLGTPALQNEPVAVVGPVVAGGSTALASSFSGLLPGIIYRSPGSLDDRAPKQVDQGAVVGNSSATAEELAEAATSSSASPGVMLASSSSADALALTKADRITELASRLGRWLGLNTGEEGATAGGDLAEPDLLA
ncbi:MAG TPA: Ig-like domain-containing protein, partial [Isosphaeraceae bacterium]|nr:Ig-like domain-containing protein [Isosphaeraceae bacterium]